MKVSKFQSFKTVNGKQLWNTIHADKMFILEIKDKKVFKMPPSDLVETDDGYESKGVENNVD